MSDDPNHSTIEYLAQCALIGANGDHSAAMSHARRAVTILAKWKLEAIIEADDAARETKQLCGNEAC